MIVGGDSMRESSRRGVRIYLFTKPTSILNLTFGEQCSKYCFLKGFLKFLFLDLTYRFFIDLRFKL